MCTDREPTVITDLLSKPADHNNNDDDRFINMPTYKLFFIETQLPTFYLTRFLILIETETFIISKILNTWSK